MTFETPLGLLSLLAVPAIVLLYLLKQKHEDYTISSLYLWKKAVQDLEASTPWQKLRKNVLMLLQILAVLIISFILSGPIVNTGLDTGSSVVLVIDCSLSMQSDDVKPSRFEAAVRDLTEYVESSDAGTEFTLIASGKTPYIVLSNTADKRKLLEEVKKLKPTDAADDAEMAAELVSSVVSQNPDTKVVWYGDGINPLNYQNAVYRSYNGNGQNFAVSSLTYAINQDTGKITALSRISNYSEETVEVDLSLYADGVLISARSASIGPKGSQNIYWNDVPLSASLIECRIDNEDMLLKDNSAWAVIYPDAAEKVLLASGGNIFLEKLISLLPGMELYRTTPEDAERLEGYDLYIFDGTLPEKLPTDGHLIVFNPPENSLFPVTGQTEYPVVRAFDGHWIYEGLKGGISFGALKTKLLSVPSSGSPVMETDLGIAAYESYIGKNRVIVFGFDLHETNLPVQPFFPVIMARAVQELAASGPSNMEPVYAGAGIDLPVSPEADEAIVFTPSGKSIKIAPPFPPSAFGDTEEAGIYTVEQHTASGKLEYKFCVNPPSDEEFSSRASDGKAAEQPVNRRQGGDPAGGINIKAPLLWLLLGIIIIEWRVYANGSV